MFRDPQRVMEQLRMRIAELNQVGRQDTAAELNPWYRDFETLADMLSASQYENRRLAVLAGQEIPC